MKHGNNTEIPHAYSLMKVHTRSPPEPRPHCRRQTPALLTAPQRASQERPLQVIANDLASLRHEHPALLVARYKVEAK